MTVINVVGTSGVGKSYLVRQLAALECLPAFFEGEEGVIPHEVFQSVFSGDNPLPRFAWFMERERRILEAARVVSDAGIDCYTDAGPMNAYGNLAAEEPEEVPMLRTVCDTIRHLEGDKIVLITASEDRLRELISGRARTSEPVEKALARSLRMQDEFLRLAKDNKKAIVIDRTELEFSNYDDLQKILRKIRE